MSLAIIHARAAVGIDAPLVRAEVHVAGGLPGMNIVGLPEAAVREAKDRVRAALQNSGFRIPPRRVTINLAPADLPKDGSRFDLAIAIGILKASGQLHADTDGLEFLGELSLSGELRAVSAVLPAVIAATGDGHELILPAGNGAEAAIVRRPGLRCAARLLDVCAALSDGPALPAPERAPAAPAAPLPDLADVRGQPQARRALEVAAAGGHNLLLLGPPGSGKSMLAQRLPGILPRLGDADALETASIQSASRQGFASEHWGRVPFRSPHHSASPAALVGGGGLPRPGEVSLAHNGALFLDELPEFQRSALEMLREPLETGRIHISRAARQADFPARFQLIAAMNPCPCGYLGDPSARCHCTLEQVSRYRRRVSGPLLDRIDLQIQVPRLPPAELLSPQAPGEPSATVRDRVTAARQRQLARGGRINAQLTPAELEEQARLDAAGRALLHRAAEHLQLSARSLHRVTRVARTIADLAGSADIATPHLAEALQYRQLERDARRCDAA